MAEPTLLERNLHLRAAGHAAALELVVAVAENDAIGRAQGLPWRLSADLRRFKSLTVGKPILMGRRTYDSIGKALPGRTNLVLSRSLEFGAGDCTVVDTVAQALREARADAVLMVIGGAEVYRQCLPIASRIHLTLVHTRIADADTFFPEWREPEWHETARERHEADEKNQYPYSFLTLERSRPRAAGADA
jgi:dihydrofolate reductase